MIFRTRRIERRVFCFPLSRRSGLHMNTSNTTHPSRTLLLLAFAIVYVFWGSTYLAIRVAVETLPPFFSGAIRFLIAGGALLALLRLRGLALPDAAQWRRSLVAGALLSVG